MPCSPRPLSLTLLLACAACALALCDYSLVYDCLDDANCRWRSCGFCNATAANASNTVPPRDYPDPCQQQHLVFVEVPMNGWQLCELGVANKGFLACPSNFNCPARWRIDVRSWRRH